ncbi:MAG: shikimate dehydrogenase [Thermoplasmata archaeon]
MSLIVASLVERSLAGVSDSSKRAFREGADVVELRLDCLKTFDENRLGDVRAGVPGPAIATLRSTSEGGRSRLKGKKRASILAGLTEHGFDYIDLELENDKWLLKELRTRKERPRTIASAHFRRPVSREVIEATLAEACSLGDIGKVAMACEHAGHAIMLAQVGMKFSRLGEKHVLIGMGDQGQLTRVCAKQMGSCMEYVCLEGKQAAPGQLDLLTQRALGDERRVILGLIGHPVSHSVSKPMHEAALRKSRLPGIYLPLDIPPGWFEAQALETLSSLGFLGVNVTIPHKREALRFCSRKSASAAATGAVNTIKFERGLVIGENTDTYGFSKLIEGKMRIAPNTRALLIGAGGAARAAAHVLTSQEGKITVAARRLSQAREIADAFEGEAITMKSLAQSDRWYDLIVNCTPLGMVGKPARCAVPIQLINKKTVLFDLVYNPPVTATMRAAMKRGARAYGGLEMLVHQGAKSFQIWTGKPPDLDALRRAAREGLE